MTTRKKNPSVTLHYIPVKTRPTGNYRSIRDLRGHGMSLPRVGPDAPHNHKTNSDALNIAA